ncbi:MAG: putative Zn-dependent protease, minimal metalloprotease (MMP)-like domain [Verrucomicrobia bacterium]|nr:MAG: putative Zn-dependent protease, minimal metalloprotease (MMP)-like domain [Verrucomicrobiota bacterium]
MHPVSRESFANLVADALAALPADLRQHLDHVQISIEDEPSPEDYRLNDVPDDEDLFGLFEGAALTDSMIDADAALPNRIRIFQRPHEEVCDSLDALREEVFRTVHHEVAHHFGIDDDRLEEIGAY